MASETSDQALEGPSFYDTDTVSRTYLGRRESADHPNTLMELPHVAEFVGAVDGRRVADLGCGDARFGVDLLDRGAAGYWGLEGSRKMAAAASAALAGRPAEVTHGRIQDWDPAENTFDVVTSRMALHYLPDVVPTFRSVASALRPGGRFVFSVEHPVVTSCYDAADPNDFPERWEVRDYFVRGGRRVDWLGATSLKYHRTVQDHLDALRTAGLRFSALREGDPLAVTDSYDAVRRHRRHVPMYLVVAAEKPGTPASDGRP